MRKLYHVILCIILAAIMLPTHAAAMGLENWQDLIQGGLENLIPDQGEHTHSYDILKSNTATCTEPGTAVYSCRCGDEMEVPSEATGEHRYGAMEYLDLMQHSAVCTVCSERVAEDHTWDNGRTVTEANCSREGEQVFTCSGCQGIYSKKLARTGHNYDPAVSNETYHICSYCNQKESHYWDDGEVTKRPTCSETCTFVYYCSICQMKLVEPLEKLKSHTYDNACDPECNACGAKRDIEHTFSTVWSKNYKGHWHECTKCAEQKNFAKHTAGPEATEKEEQICLTCKYIIEPKKNHVHSYEKQRSYDEVGHWYQCTGCGNEKEYASHRYDNGCDPDCNTCGYERDNAHEYSEHWQMSNFEHWKVCAVCNLESDRQKHTPGEEATDQLAQVCTMCGFELMAKLEHVHDFGTEWFQKEDSHWQICICGEQSVPQSHIWDSGKELRNGSVIYTCTACSLEKTVETPSSGVPGMVILLMLLALVCLVGIAVLVFIMKWGYFTTRKDEDYDANSEMNMYE